MKVFPVPTQVSESTDEYDTSSMQLMDFSFVTVVCFFRPLARLILLLTFKLSLGAIVLACLVACHYPAKQVSHLVTGDS